MTRLRIRDRTLISMGTAFFLTTVSATAQEQKPTDPTDSEVLEFASSVSTEAVPIVLLEIDGPGDDPESKSWRSGIRWLLAWRLEATRAVRLLPNPAIQIALREAATEGQTEIDDELARRIGERLEAQHVVRGDFRLQADKWKATLYAQPISSDAEPRRIESEASNPLELTERLVVAFLESVGVKPTEAELARIRRGPTRSDEAFALFVRSLRFADGNSAVTQETWADAVRSAQGATKADGKFVGAGVRLARLFGAARKMDSAREILQMAVRIDPLDPEAFVALGDAQLGLRDFGEAEKAFQRARELRPHQMDALGNLGHLFLETGRFEDARAILEEASRLDPTSASARVMLARAFVALKRRDDALQAATDALRVGYGNPDVVHGCSQLFETLSDAPSALRACERLAELLASSGVSQPKLEATRQRIARLRKVLVPRFVRVEKPRDYLASELKDALARHLSEEEMGLVVNPLESSDEIEKWAEEITAGATTDRDRARAIFDALARRVQTEIGGRTRTAREVFTAWGDSKELFNCQEFAKLYIVLARAVGLDAFLVHLERDYAGDVVEHACAGVLLEEGALLVDPAYRWFGVRHVSFRFLDDLQTVAYELFQLPLSAGGLARCYAAAKLYPNSTWGQVCLSAALIGEGEVDKANSILADIERREPGRWDVKALRGERARRAGKFDEAEAHYREALLLYPKSTQLHHTLAVVLSEQGRLLECRDELRLALRLGLKKDRQTVARRHLVRVDEKLGRLTSPLFGRLFGAKGSDARAHEIGVRGELSRFEIIGAETFRAEEIVRALRFSPYMLIGLHPRALSEDVLPLVEREVTKGYLDAGFPDADVHAAIDETRTGITLRLTEGGRVRAGAGARDGKRSHRGEGDRRTALRAEAGLARRGQGIVGSGVEPGRVRFFLPGHDRACPASCHVALRPSRPPRSAGRGLVESAGGRDRLT